jgi:hypothetical protein
MRCTLIALSLLFVSFSFSCHSSSVDSLPSGTNEARPAVEAIHNPEFRRQVKKEVVAEYKESLHDPLNTDWVFAVRLFETDKTQFYRVNLRYEELEADDTLKLPDLGTPPRPVIHKGDDKNSCMIGFMDNENRFREYKLVTVKGDKLTIHAVKHYAVSRGDRLVDLGTR